MSQGHFPTVVRNIAVLVFLFAVSSALFAQLPAGVTKGVTVEGITEYDLANGLRVLLLPDNSSPKLTVNVTYLVGSRNEGYGEKGMAHLLEHMMFRGTQHNPAGKKQLTDHGAEFNGSTWYDRTNYFETMPSADTTLAWALGYEADRMVNCSILKEEFDKEMTVVRNEFEEDENSPAAILEERVIESAYLWHNYGFPTIGPKSDIERVPVDRLHTFYAKYYQPDNAVLIIGGKFDVAKALPLIAQTFGAIPKPTRVIEQTFTTEPPQDGERSVTLRRTGDVWDVCAAYHIPSGSDPDAAPIEMLMTIIGDRSWGRLYHSLVETKLASSVRAYPYSLKEPGVAIAFAETHHGDSIDIIKDIFVKTLEGVATSTITDDEITRARAGILKEYDLTSNSSDQLAIQLSEYAGMGDWRMFFVSRDRIKSVTADDVKRVAAAYLKSSNRTLGVFIPTKSPDRTIIPPQPNIAEIVGAYKTSAVVEEGEVFDASPENIDARTKVSQLPVGTTLALLQKKTRAGKVTGSFQLRFGTESSLTGKRSPSTLAAGMLMRGTKHHTREQINSMLDTMKAVLSVSGSLASANVYFETTRDHLAPLLDLIAEVLREPAFDEKEFGLWKEAKVTNLESSRSQPFSIAMTEFGRRLSPFPPTSIHYAPSLDEQIAEAKNANLDEARKFYKTFYGASNSELSIVGDFDGSAVTAQLTKLFNGWKSPSPYARITQPYTETDTTSADIAAPDKEGAVVIGGEPFRLRDDDPDYPALTIGNYLLGGGELTSRLSLRIRDKEGLSYGVGSFVSSQSEDSVSLFGAYGICAPQNVKKFEASLRDEIAQTLHDGFATDELDKGRSGYLQMQKVGRADDRSLAFTLAQNLYEHRTMAWDAAKEKKIAALSADEIIAAMRKHLDPKKLFVIRVSDPAKN